MNRDAWDWEYLFPLLRDASTETLYMLAASAFFTVLIGLPLGVLLRVTAPGGLAPIPGFNRVLDVVVNIGRSLPFIILLVAILPFTRFLVGSALGATAVIVPLSVSAIPFFARLVESSLREVDRGVVDAAVSMGSSRTRIVSRVLLPEALPSIVSGLTVTVIALVGYTAMAGAIGAGGLGTLAVNIGYRRNQTDVTIATVVLLIVFVQLIQFVGDSVARLINHK